MKKFILILLVLSLLLTAAMASDTAISSVTTSSFNGYSRAPSTWTALGVNGSTNYLAWPNGYDTYLFLNVTWANSTSNYFSVMADTSNPAAFRSTIGNKTLSNLVAGNYRIGPLDSAQFKNTTGYLKISGNRMQGTVSVLKAIRR